MCFGVVFWCCDAIAYQYVYLPYVYRFIHDVYVLLAINLCTPVARYLCVLRLYRSLLLYHRELLK